MNSIASMKGTFTRKVMQILQNIWPIRRSKFWVPCRRVLKIILLPFALLVVLVIRLISRWLIIRIGIMSSTRIGHFAGDTELYLCNRDAGINIPKKKYIDLWYFVGPICNEQLARMWKRVLIIGPTLLLSLLDRVNGFIRGNETHRIQHIGQDIYNLLDHIPSHLQLDSDEEKEGHRRLKAFKIPDGKSFVGIIVRDSMYLNTHMPEHNWHCHDHRNSSIENYVLVALELAKLGYYVFRMGAIVKDRFPVSHPMIIDYATNGMRSDFMDVYLIAKCNFIVSTGTGVDSLAWVFRKPLVHVSLSPVARCLTSSAQQMFIPKKYFLKSEKRFLSFREIFNSEAGIATDSNYFSAKGIEPVENTAEEITAVVLEMEARLNGSWETSEEDEELQELFWGIFPRSVLCPKTGKPLHGEIRSRIGAEFLRQNKALLD